VILEAQGIAEVDYTAAAALRAVIEDCRRRGHDFAIARLESERARQSLERFGVLEVLGPDRLFLSVAHAVEATAASRPASAAASPPSRNT
jgi:MFS superfamily sulfate permease-like transporter